MWYQELQPSITIASSFTACEFNSSVWIKSQWMVKSIAAGEFNCRRWIQSQQVNEFNRSMWVNSWIQSQHVNSIAASEFLNSIAACEFNRSMWIQLQHVNSIAASEFLNSITGSEFNHRTCIRPHVHIFFFNWIQNRHSHTLTYKLSRSVHNEQIPSMKCSPRFPARAFSSIASLANHGLRLPKPVFKMCVNADFVINASHPSANHKKNHIQLSVEEKDVFKINDDDDDDESIITHWVNIFYKIYLHILIYYIYSPSTVRSSLIHEQCWTTQETENILYAEAAIEPLHKHIINRSIVERHLSENLPLHLTSHSVISTSFETFTTGDLEANMLDWHGAPSGYNWKTSSMKSGEDGWSASNFLTLHRPGTNVKVTILKYICTMDGWINVGFTIL